MKKIIQKKNKAYPVKLGPTMPNWMPAARHSLDPVICIGCQENNLFWGWNFAKNKPMLVDHLGYNHNCKAPPPNQCDIFPGWCDTCGSANLSFIRNNQGFELVEEYGLPHACEQEKTLQEVKHAKCQYCKKSDLLWIKINSKFSLVDFTGTTHHCHQYNSYIEDWREAKRMNYAFEKARMKAIPDDTPCKKCKGRGFTSFYAKSKKYYQRYNSSEPILMHRRCHKCDGIGIFTLLKKKNYLKTLRLKYWPFKGGTHKWKKYDNMSGL